jgi:hypothetical protein
MTLKMSSIGAAVVVAITAGFGPANAATAIGVTEVIITSALPDYLQVAEVTAFDLSGAQVFFNNAIGSSVYQAGYSTAAKAIDGNIGGNYYTDGMFHSASPSSAEFLKLTFSSAVNLGSLSFYGRTDNGGGVRDLYSVNINGSTGGTFTVDARGGKAPLTFTSPVPEPSEIAMMASGLAVVGLFAKRRRLVVKNS